MAAPEPTFADFIRRLRAGDARAAAELVRRYEPHLRRIVRLNLAFPHGGGPAGASAPAPGRRAPCPGSTARSERRHRFALLGAGGGRAGSRANRLPPRPRRRPNGGCRVLRKPFTQLTLAGIRAGSDWEGRPARCIRTAAKESAKSSNGFVRP